MKSCSRGEELFLWIVIISPAKNNITTPTASLECLLCIRERVCLPSRVLIWYVMEIIILYLYYIFNYTYYVMYFFVFHCQIFWYCNPVIQIFILQINICLPQQQKYGITDYSKTRQNYSVISLLIKNNYAIHKLWST